MKIRITILALLCLSAISAYAKNPNVKAYCNNRFVEASPGWVSVPSQHGVTIINKSATPLVYDVYFDNQIQYPKLRDMPLDYSEPPYIPNAHKEHHFTVPAGQTFYFGEVTIEKQAGFIKKGHYKTKALTTVMFNGVLLDQCQHFNNIEIF